MTWLWHDDVPARMFSWCGCKTHPKEVTVLKERWKEEAAKCCFSNFYPFNKTSPLINLTETCQYLHKPAILIRHENSSYTLQQRGPYLGSERHSHPLISVSQKSRCWLTASPPLTPNQPFKPCGWRAPKFSSSPLCHVANVTTTLPSTTPPCFPSKFSLPFFYSNGTSWKSWYTVTWAKTTLFFSLCNVTDVATSGLCASSSSPVPFSWAGIGPRGPGFQFFTC